MRAAISFLLIVTLAGCFANPQHRRYAKLGEGGSIIAGIAMLSVAGTGADCNASPGDRAGREDCRLQATVVGDLGLGLILAGILGFVVTTSFSPDETPPPPPASLATKPTTKTPKPPAVVPVVQ